MVCLADFYNSMRILDKIYLNLYWAGRRGKGGGWLEFSLERAFIFPFFSVLTLLLGALVKLLGVNLGIPVIIVISIVLSLILSFKLVDNYYTEEKRGIILKNHKKPGLTKYVIVIGLILGGFGLAVLSTIFIEHILE